MKGSYKIGLLLVPFLFLTCKKDIGIINLSLKYQTSITVPSSAGVSVPITIPTPDIATNSSQEFRSQGVDASKIREIKLNSMVLSITSPPGKTYSFLKSIHLYIVSPSLPEIEIAYLDNIPVNVSSITMIPLDKDISEYVKGETFKLRAKVVTRETLLQDVSMKAELILGVKASVL